MKKPDTSLAVDCCPAEATPRFRSFHVLGSISYGLVGLCMLALTSSACDGLPRPALFPSGVYEEAGDADFDGWIKCDPRQEEVDCDCNDAVDSINPCAADIEGNGVNEDCDGDTDEGPMGYAESVEIGCESSSS